MGTPRIDDTLPDEKSGELMEDSQNMYSVDELCAALRDGGETSILSVASPVVSLSIISILDDDGIMHDLEPLETVDSSTHELHEVLATENSTANSITYELVDVRATDNSPCLSSAAVVILWPDGCSYQNRNSILSNALLHLSMLRNVTIIQKYLEKGHTQMECDSVHSTIERRIEHTDIHLTSQYASYSESARTLPMPYRATALSFDFTRDFGVTDSMIYPSIRPGKKKGDPTVTDLRWIQYEPNGKICYKLNFEDDLKELPIRPKRLAPRECFPQLHLTRPKIPLDKWRDLQSLKSLLPSDTHDFYDNIPYEEESRRALKRQHKKENDDG